MAEANAQRFFQHQAPTPLGYTAFKMTFNTSYRSSMPSIKPKPRTSLTILCFSCKPSRPALKYLPIFSACSANLSSTNASIAAHPAAQTSGLPLKVVECSPTLRDGHDIFFSYCNSNRQAACKRFSQTHNIRGNTPVFASK